MLKGGTAYHLMTEGTLVQHKSTNEIGIVVDDKQLREDYYKLFIYEGDDRMGWVIVRWTDGKMDLCRKAKLRVIEEPTT